MTLNTKLPALSRAGFAAIIGAPNAGKSTLVNALVGEKVSIVTHKVQTTRFQVRGIAMLVDREENDAQVVLVDTPGIFKAGEDDRLGRSMVHAAWSGVSDSDATIHVVDAPGYLRVLDQEPTAQDKRAFKDTERVTAGLKKREEKKAFLALNKIDEIAHDRLLEVISAFKDSDIYRDASTVETEKWTRQKNGDIRIDQIIYVKRTSQKPIVLGKGGRTIRDIGAAARQDMQEWLGTKVHLFLFVKVRWKIDSCFRLLMP